MESSYNWLSLRNGTNIFTSEDFRKFWLILDEWSIRLVVSIDYVRAKLWFMIWFDSDMINLVFCFLQEWSGKSNTSFGSLGPCWLQSSLVNQIDQKVFESWKGREFFLMIAYVDEKIALHFLVLISILISHYENVRLMSHGKI